MIIVCAYCKKMLGEKEPLEDKHISHGICDECEKKINHELDMKELLKKLDKPPLE